MKTDIKMLLARRKGETSYAIEKTPSLLNISLYPQRGHKIYSPNNYVCLL